MRIAAHFFILGLLGPLTFGTGDAFANDDEIWAIHGQSTLVVQGTPSFPSPYRGSSSLSGSGELSHTFDATLFSGFRPWAGGEIWINTELDQGFALSKSQGAAAFPNGEGSKVGSRSPYVKIQRLFLRHTFGLGGELRTVEPEANQLGGSQLADRLVMTVGKFSVVDVFDGNKYAHDPKKDFLNLGIVDTGSFDYAANAWGYTVGASAELYWSDWAVRAGLFDMSRVPNDKRLDPNFSQNQLVLELERRYQLFGQSGSVRLTSFASHAKMARYDDVLTGPVYPVDPAPFRRFRTRTGIAFNFDQDLTSNAGMFVRAGVSEGKLESYEFTDVDRTLAAGLVFSGRLWGSPKDSIGAAVLLNSISSSHQAYFDAGGLGLYVGDGKLPHPGTERVGELFYKRSLSENVSITLNYQLIRNPGYNRDRGPVSVLGTRLHAEF